MKLNLSLSSETSDYLEVLLAALLSADTTRVQYCIVERSRRLMPPHAQQPKAYCTNPGL